MLQKDNKNPILSQNMTIYQKKLPKWGVLIHYKKE